MANKNTRAWYVDRLKRIGIVEKATNAVTKDGHSTDWTSISEAKDLRLYCISRDADLNTTALTNTWSQIPEQFHEVLIYKVIAMGYKDPRNMGLENALYFEKEYIEGVKEGKKFSRSNYQSTGFVRPQDY